MTAWRYGIAAASLVALGACSNMMGGGSSNSPRPAAMVAPPVAPAMVKQVQSTLRDDGYYKNGPVDGVWGPGTEAAVRSFQHDHSLTSSGQLDSPTLQAMNIPNGGNNNPPPAYNNPPTQPNAPADSTQPPRAQ